MKSTRDNHTVQYLCWGSHKEKRCFYQKNGDAQVSQTGTETIASRIHWFQQLPDMIGDHSNWLEEMARDLAAFCGGEVKQEGFGFGNS